MLSLDQESTIEEIKYASYIINSCLDHWIRYILQIKNLIELTVWLAFVQRYALKI